MLQFFKVFWGGTWGAPILPPPTPCVHLWLPSLLRPDRELNENWCSNNHHSHPVICCILPIFLFSLFFHFMTSQLEFTCVCLSVCLFYWLCLLRVCCVTSSYDDKIKCKNIEKNNWYLANGSEDFKKIQSCNIFFFKYFFGVPHSATFIFVIFGFM